jgi:3-hydroxymyristoyl/3-hydroxydecanoyl-(acyl carrier protein) dehydratase
VPPVEAEAQLARVVAQSDPAIQLLSGLKLAGLRQVKFLGSTKPGDMVRIEVRITGRLGGCIHAEARAFVARELVLTAGTTLSGGVGAQDSSD